MKQERINLTEALVKTFKGKEKDLSIICFNEKQWIGNGFIIPSGPLREGL